MHNRDIFKLKHLDYIARRIVRMNEYNHPLSTETDRSKSRSISYVSIKYKRQGKRGTRDSRHITDLCTIHKNGEILSPNSYLIVLSSIGSTFKYNTIGIMTYPRLDKYITLLFLR